MTTGASGKGIGNIQDLVKLDDKGLVCAVINTTSRARS